MARDPFIGLDPQTGDMMIRPLVQPAIRPAPTYNANAFPFSPSRGVAPQQPVSPVAGLTQLGQQGLQGAERISKQVAKSPKVQGLLGGSEGASGLLSDIQGDAALQGLFATMQAIGRPVRRGEDRFMGATQYGQQVMNQAQQRGMQDLSTRMQLEEFARKQQIADARRAALEGMASEVPSGEVTSFTEYEIGQMDESQQALARQSEMLRRRGLQLVAADPTSTVGKELLGQAKELRENSLVGIRTRTDQAKAEKELRSELAPSLKKANEVAAYHNQVVDLTKNALEGSFVSGYAGVVAALKTIEPTSAVLSSEYESARSLQGLIDQAVTLFEGAKGQMSPQMAQSLRDVASASAKTAMEVRSSLEDQYAPIVEENFLRPNQVFLKPVPLKQMPQVFDFGGESQQRKGEDAARAAAEELISTMDGGA